MALPPVDAVQHYRLFQAGTAIGSSPALPALPPEHFDQIHDLFIKP
jgi:hypothetical protein